MGLSTRGWCGLCLNQRTACGVASCQLAGCRLKADTLCGSLRLRASALKIPTHFVNTAWCS